MCEFIINSCTLFRFISDVCRKLRWRDYSVEQQHRKGIEETGATCWTHRRQEVSFSCTNATKFNKDFYFAIVKQKLLALLTLICLSFLIFLYLSMLCSTQISPILMLVWMVKKTPITPSPSLDCSSYQDALLQLLLQVKYCKLNNNCAILINLRVWVIF